MTNQTVEQTFDLALKHHQAGRLGEAARLYQEILQRDPKCAEALHHLGIVEAQAGRTQSAMSLIRHAISLRPDYAEAHNNLGNALVNGPEPEEAVRAYRQAVALRPSYFEAHNNLGIALRKVGRFDEAIAAFRAATALRPSDPDAFNNLGNALKDAGLLEDAIAAYRQAIALRNRFPEAFNNLGTALREKRQLDEAAAAFGRAIDLQPNFARALNNLASVLKAKGQMAESIAVLRQAIAHAPGDRQLHSNLIYDLCFLAGATAGEIRAEAVGWNDRHASPLLSQIQPWKNDRNPDRPLRIGYISPNFRHHTNGYSMLPLLKHHDRAQYQTFCYSDVKRPDDMTRQCERASDNWRNLVGLTDEKVADLIRQDRIDVLVDLVSHMASNRLLVFARKPAPVQTTYLCNQATTGLSTIEYRITDAHIDPPGFHEGHYVEKTIRLPECYLVFEAPTDSPPVNELPALRNGFITFGSLNNFCKVTPPVLETWSRLLTAVPNSRLFLRCPDGETQRRVIDFFATKGIDKARLILYSLWPQGTEYLKLHHQMDIYLDPFPHTGHTTSMDALWMGLPLITLAGATAGGRGGVSLLANLGLENLIATNERDYIEKAAALANDLPRLANLRATLRDLMSKSPLVDAPRFARNIEVAYRQMWKHWCAGV